MILYNKELLNISIEKDKATYIESYINKSLIKLEDLVKLTRNCYIKFICKCNTIYTNNFRNA